MGDFSGEIPIQSNTTDQHKSSHQSKITGRQKRLVAVLVQLEKANLFWFFEKISILGHLELLAPRSKQLIPKIILID